MEILIKYNYSKNIFFVSLLTLAGFALFSHLSYCRLWDDEASVGIMARNYLANGNFSGWDGTNLYAYRNGTLLDDNLQYKNPIGDVIVCSWAFHLFGESTTSARLFFAFFGWLSLLLWYKVAQRLVPNRPAVAMLTLGILSTAAFYLMAMRQCRYYGLSMFMAAMATYLLLEAENQTAMSKRRALLFLMSLSLLGLFFSHYLQFATYLASIGLWYCAFRIKKLEGIRQKELIAFFLITCTIALGVGWYWDITNRTDFTQEQDPFHVKFVCLLWYNIRETNALNVLQIPVLVFLLYMWNRKPREELTGFMWQCLCIIIIYCAVLSVLSPMSTKTNATAETRYLLPMMPFGAMLIAASIVQAWEISTNIYGKAIILVIIMFFQFSNLGVIQKKDNIWTWIFPQFAIDVWRGYPSIYDEPVEVLQSSAAKSKIVRCIPDYHSYPLSFYLDKQFVFGANLDQYAINRLRIGQRKEMAGLSNQNLPDYIFVFQNLPENLDTLAQFTRRGNYRKTRTFSAYCPGVDPSRPEPNLHIFGPKNGEAERIVELYERH